MKENAIIKKEVHAIDRVAVEVAKKENVEQYHILVMITQAIMIIHAL